MAQKVTLVGRVVCEGGCCESWLCATCIYQPKMHVP